MRQQAAESVWLPSDVVALVLLLRGGPAELLVLWPELACSPALACSPVASRPPLVSLVPDGTEAWRQSVATELQLESAWPPVWLQLALQEAVLQLLRVLPEVPTPWMVLPPVWPQRACSLLV